MSLGPRRALLAALVLVAGAAGPAPAQERPPGDPTEIVNALLTGLLGLQPVTEAELQREVAEAGGLAFRSQVPVDFLTTAQMARYFEEVFDSEYPPARAQADERLLRTLDLLAAGVDLRNVRKQLFLENVIGFYDERPGRKRLYAVSADRSLTPANQLVLAHELRHALQDQYMSIHDLLPEQLSDFDDRRLSLLSLLEGDATLVMQRYLLRRLPGAEESGLDAAGMTLPPPEMPGTPPVLRDQLVLPYTLGLDFARAVQARGGWAAVREAFARPPESMEQVLHPEKYFEREGPRPVQLPDGPPGARLLAEGVLGELLLRSLLGEGAGVEAAAAGWGGDAFRVYDASGRTLVVSRTVWDSPADLREFQDALLARFGRSHGAPSREGSFAVFTRAGSLIAVGESHSGLTLLASDEGALLKTMLQRVAAW